jgi:hypothetical protein
MDFRLRKSKNYSMNSTGPGKKFYFTNAFIAVLFFTHLSTANATKPEILGIKTVSVNGKSFRIVIDRVWSVGTGNGQGYCGAGEETTLHVFSGTPKKEVFSETIESCVEAIRLNENDSIIQNKNALKWDENVGILIEGSLIQIPWSFNGRHGVGVTKVPFSYKDPRWDILGIVDLSVDPVKENFKAGKGRCYRR